MMMEKELMCEDRGIGQQEKVWEHKGGRGS